jgi:hypothetical protein
MALQGDASMSRVVHTTEAAPLIGLDEWTKRVADIVIATMGLVLFAPDLLLAAMAISLESEGPIFVSAALPGCNSRAIRFRVTCAAGNRINLRPTLVGQILNLMGIRSSSMFSSAKCRSSGGGTSLVGPDLYASRQPASRCMRRRA